MRMHANTAEKAVNTGKAVRLKSVTPLSEHFVLPRHEALQNRKSCLFPLTRTLGGGGAPPANLRFGFWAKARPGYSELSSSYTYKNLRFGPDSLYTDYIKNLRFRPLALQCNDTGQQHLIRDDKVRQLSLESLSNAAESG